MKKNDRTGAIVRILTRQPNRVFPLGYFSRLFQSGKSTVSEDISAARQTLAELGLGRIETIAGARGGVKFEPAVSETARVALLDRYIEKLKDGSRILGGGFLYTTDLTFDPELVSGAAELFAERFSGLEADYVVTIETKGIPLAFMTAFMLNLPLVAVRRESRVSEGSTVSINYFSGSTDRIQKMSLAKRAVEPGRRAIIIDDFMRAGGSVRGIKDILEEFEVRVVGTGVLIAALEPEKKKIDTYYPLLYLGDVDENRRVIEIFRNDE